MALVLPELIHTLVIERVLRVGVPVSLLDDLGVEEELCPALEYEDAREDPAVPVGLLPVVFEPNPLPLAHSRGECGGLLAVVLDRFVRVLGLRGVDAD
jgi:hypothetical protein